MLAGLYFVYTAGVEINLARRVILFCNKHSLSLSVKAGGYGTGGWAIGGDVIIDLCKITDADIEPPGPDGSYTSLNDVASANSKGKKAIAATQSLITSQKRSEDDRALRMYDFASLRVADFLRTPLALDIRSFPLSPPSTAVHRGPDFVENTSPRSPGGSVSSSPHSDNSGTNFGTNTILTTPSPANADPFGYMNSCPAAGISYSFGGPPRPVLLSNLPSLTLGGLQSHPLVNVSQFPLHTEAEPTYLYAFVTFGAGMRQKEVDTFTAKHKLEARYTSGFGDGIPYHVPL
jgi:hypothetical protein